MHTSVFPDLIAASKQLDPVDDTRATSAPHWISFLRALKFPEQDANIAGGFCNDHVIIKEIRKIQTI